MTPSLLEQIRKELKKLSNSIEKESYLRFFKEPVVFYGVRSSDVKKIATTYRKKIAHLPKQEIFWLCESLFASDYCEEAFIACNRVERLEKHYEEKDFFLFEKWIQKYINNRAKCDTFCNHSVGSLIEKYPQYIKHIQSVWIPSKNRWVRRAAAVTFIIPARKGKFLKEVFQIAEALLQDTDDLIQKGYWWVLKVASNKHEKEVFSWVMKHKKVLPRTALRYAIEKMRKEWKKEAMKR